MVQIREIEINGAKYPVRYDVNSLAEYEDLTGKSFITIFQTMDIRGLRALAFVGLKCGHTHHYNKVTQFNKSLIECGEWIPINKLSEFIPIAAEFTIGDKKEPDEAPSIPGE